MQMMGHKDYSTGRTARMLPTRSFFRGCGIMETKILVVDDSVTDLLIITNMLKDFTVLTAGDGAEAMKTIDAHLDVDLVILDLNMPVMNGFEVLERLRADAKYEKIRVIILTNYDEIDNEIRGLELGAVDYIRKPVNIQSLRIRIDIHLKLKGIQKRIEAENTILDGMVAAATRELVATRDIAIHALTRLLEVRNVESFNHTMRTQQMMGCLCRNLCTKPDFRDIMTEDYIRDVVTTTPLHDIGKVGIPDSILLKPGRLTPEEYDIMKKHVEYGVTALKSEFVAGQVMPEFIRMAIEIVGGHHEKFDGTGYPKGLKADQIPLPGRLMAVIDVFDALINKRVYKDPYPWAQAIQIMKDETGTHFDPRIVGAFLEISDEIKDIAEQYR